MKHTSFLIYTVSQIDVYTLWHIISQQQNKTEIQFFGTIQKALEKHGIMFLLHMFINKLGYEIIRKNVVDIGGLNLIHHH